MKDENNIDSILGEINLLDEKIDESSENYGAILSCSMKYILNNLILNRITNKVSYDDFIEDDKKNYLSLLNKKIEFLISRNKEDEEIVKEIRQAFTEVLYSVLEKLEETFGFSFDENTGMDKSALNYTDLVQYTISLYEFLIMNRTKNLITYLYRTIFYDRKTYCANYKSKDENKKNFTFIDLKRTLKIDDAIVIYYIREIVDSIKQEDITFDEFITKVNAESNGEVADAIARRIISEDNTSVVAESFGIMDEFEVKSDIIAEVTTKLYDVLPKKVVNKEKED